MRNLNIDQPDLLTEDVRETRPCPSCGTDVTITVEAGTPRALLATILRLPATCEACADRMSAEAAAEARLERRRERVRAAGLPRALQGLTWDSYDVSRRGSRGARDAALAWARREADRPGLLLTGPVGVGKTRLAATAAYEAMLDWPLRWVSVPDMIVSVSGSFSDSGRARALKVLTGAGPLVLDDLDKVNPSMAVLSHLFTAVDRRVQSGQPLLVTTNLDPEQLEARFAGGRDAEDKRVAAEALVSRLLGHCHVFGIDGADGRL